MVNEIFESYESLGSLEVDAVTNALVEKYRSHTSSFHLVHQYHMHETDRLLITLDLNMELFTMARDPLKPGHELVSHKTISHHGNPLACFLTNINLATWCGSWQYSSPPGIRTDLVAPSAPQTIGSCLGTLWSFFQGFACS